MLRIRMISLLVLTGSMITAYTHVKYKYRLVLKIPVSGALCVTKVKQIMKITKHNINRVNISDILDYKIKIISLANRRGSNKQFNGKPNCSGYNINKLIKTGMTVARYQAIIRSNFNSNDPQFHLFKHLKWDIAKGNIELNK